MRSQRDTTASFDLFLDTICNTFGGIVFLAILLAIMIQNQSIVKSENNEGEHASPEQVRIAMAELEDASAQYKQLQMSLAAFPQSTSIVDDSELQTLTYIQSQLKEQLDTSINAETNASRMLAQTLEKNAEQRTENERIPQQLDEATKQLNKAQADYASLAEAKQQTLRLPRVRSSNMTSVLLLVRDGSLYLAKMPALFDQGFNSTQVSTKTNADKGIQVHPIPGAGWDLASGVAEQEFRNLIQDAKSQAYSMTIAIWPESYDEFEKLREQMIQQGVPYQLWPQSDGETLIVFLGGGASSVQ
ncbi:hypothetical protein Pla52o_06290 [Novipirellula galeiformis]|uniref:Uncharacterized protein n=1 Tax=Novipirellula galeiformis TaxID=2528004 RepID=A0A5C6CT43_9BACT|nr:hypothetical protein [Novipirellula galeiformis]TWU26774.1 hypothetical protein Pla52o_06290 [Novipirellula galeiformis]